MSEVEFRILTESDEYLLKGFLDEHLESSMFLYSNLISAGLHFSANRYEGVYSGAFENGELTSVVSHYWNGNLVLQAPFYVDELIKRSVSVSGLPISGLVGPVEQLSVAKGFLDITSDQLRYDSKEKLYNLDLEDLVVPDLILNGDVHGRQADLNDIEILADWRIAYRQETMAEPLTPALITSSRESVQTMVTAKRTWLIESAGEAVATSSFNATVKTDSRSGIVQVGGVWTPPSLRGNHYGRAAVATSLIDAKDAGYSRAVLFTDEENIPAQKAYTGIGFKQIGAYGLSFLANPLFL